MSQIVIVLHTDDLADPASLFDLRGSYVAQPDMTHQTLPLKVGEDGERRFERTLGGVMHVEHAAQVDYVEHIQTQIAEVVVDRLSEFFAREGRDPRSILAAPGADLGDDR